MVNVREYTFSLFHKLIKQQKDNLIKLLVNFEVQENEFVVVIAQRISPNFNS